jgi:N-acetylglucosamine-6-phosphate deacetylase
MIVIDHATVYTPGQVLENRTVLVDGARIANIGVAGKQPLPPHAQVIDAHGLLVAPGFIDLQLNGAYGDDFTRDPRTIWPVAERLPEYGVTSFLPTIITSPLAQVGKAQETLALGPQPNWRGSVPLGLHVEGPFLNPQKKGAHNPQHLRIPSLDDVIDWSPENHVSLVTLAPELPGGLELIRALAERGLVISCGHTMATYDEAEAAVSAGARYGTHIFNAMPTLEHREPGLAGALLTDDRVTIGLIPDGVHTHPAIVKLVWAAKGAHRLNLVTDAMAALGMPPGRYILSDQEVTVTERAARLASGTLAGSILGMDEALRKLIRYAGAPLSAALATITSTPADLLGIGHERGSIQPGAYADLVFLTPDLQVVKTMVEGRLVYERR